MRSPHGRVLLINPKITSHRRARFPLSLLTMAAALDDRYEVTMVDGNVESDGVAAAVRALDSGFYEAAGISVMGGPQVQTAIDVSQAIRAHSPSTPIVWGGYFPTLYPAAAINAAYVDFLVRGQGEQTLPALLGSLADPHGGDLSSIGGLTWRRGRNVIHNRDPGFSAQQPAARLPYEKLRDPGRYLPQTFLGRRTASYQAALGCRFRCTFLWRGGDVSRPHRAPRPPHRLERDLTLAQG